MQMLKYQKQVLVQVCTDVNIYLCRVFDSLTPRLNFVRFCFVRSFVEQQGVLHTHWILTSDSFLNHCLFPLFGNKLQTVQILDCYLANKFIWARTCFLFKMNSKSMPWFDFATLPEFPPWSGSDSRGRVVLWSFFRLFPALLSETRQTETHKTVAWGWSADGMNYWGLTEGDHASSSNAARPTLQFLRSRTNVSMIPGTCKTSHSCTTCTAQTGNKTFFWLFNGTFFVKHARSNLALEENIIFQANA